MAKGITLLTFLFVSLAGLSCAVEEGKEEHRTLLGKPIDAKTEAEKLEHNAKLRGDTSIPKTGGPRRLHDLKPEKKEQRKGKLLAWDIISCHACFVPLVAEPSVAGKITPTSRSNFLALFRS